MTNNLFQHLTEKPLILASQSPRRQALLNQIGLDFSVKPPVVDETVYQNEEPEEHVKKLSLLKAQKVAQNEENAIIVGADTIVCIDGDILGKPEDKQHAFEMLRRLSGHVHYVYTGFALIDRPSNRSATDVERTAVHFRTLSDAEINRYVESENPMDKAGAYGIQDFSALFVDYIEGCFYNVVGFPLTRFYLAFHKFIQ